MLEQKLREDISITMRNHNEIEKNILRLVLGEIQLRCSVAGATEDDKMNIVRKIIKGIDTSLEAIKDDPARQEEVTNLSTEKAILERYLPKSMTQEELQQFLKDNSVEILITMGEGKAIGTVVKALKASGKTADIMVVKAVVLSAFHTQHDGN